MAQRNPLHAARAVRVQADDDDAVRQYLAAFAYLPAVAKQIVVRIVGSMNITSSANDKLR
jgi:hypothetical protein